MDTGKPTAQSLKVHRVYVPIRSILITSITRVAYNLIPNMNKTKRIFIIVSMSLMMTGCLGTAVGLVVDTAIEVVKVPFKVGAAVVDVVTGDDD